MIFRADNAWEEIDVAGVPLGMMEDADYEETAAVLHPGDSMILVSDGALEVHDAGGKLLGVEGLVRILAESNYPGAPLPIKAMEDELLRYSNAIRLMDDVTLIEVRLAF